MEIVIRPDFLYLLLFSPGPGILIFPILFMTIVEDKVFSLQQKVQIYSKKWFVYGLVVTVTETITNVLFILMVALMTLIVVFWLLK